MKKLMLSLLLAGSVVGYVAANEAEVTTTNDTEVTTTEVATPAEVVEATQE